MFVVGYFWCVWYCFGGVIVGVGLGLGVVCLFGIVVVDDWLVYCLYLYCVVFGW